MEASDRKLLAARGAVLQIDVRSLAVTSTISRPSEERALVNYLCARVQYNDEKKMITIPLIMNGIMKLNGTNNNGIDDNNDI